MASNNLYVSSECVHPGCILKDTKTISPEIKGTEIFPSKIPIPLISLLLSLIFPGDVKQAHWNETKAIN